MNDEGERTGGVVFLRDITDRKVSGQRVRAALLESEMNARESRELTRLADLLESCQTLQEACPRFRKAFARHFSRAAGRIVPSINSSRNLLEAGAVWNSCSSTEQIFDPDDCWALRLGKLYGGSEPASPVRCSHLAPVWTGGYVCVPLVAQGETLGVLYVEESDDPAPSLAPVAGGRPRKAATPGHGRSRAPLACAIEFEASRGAAQSIHSRSTDRTFQPALPGGVAGAGSESGRSEKPQRRRGDARSGPLQELQ